MTEIATDALLKEIKDGLEGVTDGPWEVEYCEVGDGPDRRAYALLRCVEDESYTGIETGEVHCMEGSRIMEHLARSSPDNWRAVLARLERAESALAKIVEAHDSYIEYAPNAVENPDWLDDAINAARTLNGEDDHA